MEQSDTPRTDATQYQWTRTLDLSRDLERELSAVTRERDEWEFAARNEAKLAQVVVRERDEARAEVERLRALTICGCGDHITAHDPGVCGTCADILRMSARDGWRPASEPPDSDRLVIVWVADDRSPSNGGYFCTDCLRPSRANPDARIWASIGVTHWRDVQPPTEGA